MTFLIPVQTLNHCLTKPKELVNQETKSMDVMDHELIAKMFCSRCFKRCVFITLTYFLSKISICKAFVY